MMKLILNPQQSDATLEMYKSGDTLTINGEVFDFKKLEEGATLPYGSITSDVIIKEVYKEGGEIVINVVMPHKVYASEASRFPSPLYNIPDGKVTLPTDYDIEPVVIAFTSGEGEINA